MSIYPIISKYDINCDNLILTTSKTHSVTKQDMNFKTGKIVMVTKNYSSYKINYKYDRIGVDQFCLMTEFLKIAIIPHTIRGQMCFCVDISKNQKLKNLITSIFEALKTQILKIKPNLSPNDIAFPLTNKKVFVDEIEYDKEYVNISLAQFNKKIITPIHYHRTKKQGGEVVTIVNKPVDCILEELTKEMELFKYSSYGKDKRKTENSQKNDNPPLLQMYYEGKFTLFFTIEHIELCETDIESKKREYCNVYIFAKEAETKYNVSRVKSVLDVDVTALNRINTKQPDILKI